LPENRRCYLFIDEVQLVDSFELAINSIVLVRDVDIYLTGSNAQMLSSDLRRLLVRAASTVAGGVHYCRVDSKDNVVLLS